MVKEVEEVSKEKKVHFEQELARLPTKKDAVRIAAPVSNVHLIFFPTERDERIFIDAMVEVLARNCPLNPFIFAETNLQMLFIKTIRELSERHEMYKGIRDSDCDKEHRLMVGLKEFMKN